MKNDNASTVHYTGLHTLYSLSWYQCPIYIFDNHNYALYFWTQWLRETKHIPWTVIHIDQHTDMRPNEYTLDMQYLQNDAYLQTFATEYCTIGNFIPPLLDAWVLAQCEQTRTERKLLNYEDEIPTQLLSKPYILDIDLDFRAPEMSIHAYHKTLEKTRQLLRNASLVTIATSPWFIDQQLAITVLKDIFEHI